MCCVEEEDWKVKLCGVDKESLAGCGKPTDSAPSRMRTKRRTQLSAGSAHSAAHQTAPRTVLSRLEQRGWGAVHEEPSCFPCWQAPGVRC